MATFVIHNKNTGRVDGDCAVCGIYTVSSDDDIELYQVDSAHAIRVLARHEVDVMRQVNPATGRYKHRITEDGTIEEDNWQTVYYGG